MTSAQRKIPLAQFISLHQGNFVFTCTKGPASVYNIDRNSPARALGAGADQRPNLHGNAALASDNLPHILRGDAELQCQLLLPLNLRDGDGIRIFH